VQGPEAVLLVLGQGPEAVLLVLGQGPERAGVLVPQQLGVVLVRDGHRRP
jgi:hypothetical protein